MDYKSIPRRKPKIEKKEVENMGFAGGIMSPGRVSTA